MRLTYIKLNHFKGFEDFYLSFQKEDGSVRSVTMLLGENGTGKTNLLKAIALAVAGSNALIDIIGNPADWISMGKDKCSIAFGIDHENFVLEFHQKDGKADVLSRNRTTLERIDNILSYSFAIAYGTNRKFNVFNEFIHPYETNFSLNFTHLGNLFNEEYLYPLTVWLQNLNYYGNETSMKIFHFVIEYIDLFLRNIQFHSIDKQKKQLLFTENNVRLPISELSEGYQNILALMGDILYKFFHSSDYFSKAVEDYDSQENPLNTIWNNPDNFGLLLIDEVELHLHPEWQREFVTFLREKMPPSFQIIMTTHSPIAAQQTEEGELFTLQKIAGKITVLPFEAAPFKLPIDELLISSAFGLSTDESLKVEKWKTAYKQLKSKVGRTEAENIEFERLKENLQMLPDKKGSAYFSEEHFHLLQKIEKELAQTKL